MKERTGEMESKQTIKFYSISAFDEPKKDEVNAVHLIYLDFSKENLKTELQFIWIFHFSYLMFPLTLFYNKDFT